MSQYLETETQFTDPALLCTALEAQGFEVEQHVQGAKLNGFGGDDSRTAHVIIRQSSKNASVNGSMLSDIGFARQSDGRYALILDDYNAGGHSGWGDFGQSWQRKLSQSYAEHQHLRTARLKGYQFLGRTQTAKGEVKLRFGVR